MESKFGQLLTQTSQLITAAEQDLSELPARLSALRCEAALSTHASEQAAVEAPRKEAVGLMQCGEHGYHVYAVDGYMHRAHEHRKALTAKHGPLMHKLGSSHKKFAAALMHQVGEIVSPLTKEDRQRFNRIRAEVLGKLTKDKDEQLLAKVGISDELLEEFYRCHRKKAYPLPERARAQQQLLEALDNRGGVMVTYQCCYCTGWHVGHASKPDNPKQAWARKLRSARLLLQNRSKARAFFAEKGLGEPPFVPAWGA